MKQNVFMKIAVAIIVMFSQTANADDVRAGIPGYGGNGCPPGSVHLAISPDGKWVSILPDDLVSESGKSVGKSSDSKTCSLAIPVHVPQGMSILANVRLNGYVAAPRLTKAELELSTFYGGGTGPILTKKFVNPIEQDYEMTTEHQYPQMWSLCGVDTNVRIQIKLKTASSAKKQQVFLKADDLKVEILSRPCP